MTEEEQQGAGEEMEDVEQPADEESSPEKRPAKKRKKSDAAAEPYEGKRAFPWDFFGCSVIPVGCIVTLGVVGAYAKLYGKCLKTGEVFEAYLTDLPCELGRAHNNQPESNFISLGSSKQISRIHASIDYDYSLGCFTIEPKGWCARLGFVRVISEVSRCHVAWHI